MIAVTRLILTPVNMLRSDDKCIQKAAFGIKYYEDDFDETIYASSMICQLQKAHGLLPVFCPSMETFTLKNHDECEHFFMAWVPDDDFEKMGRDKIANIVKNMVIELIETITGASISELNMNNN